MDKLIKAVDLLVMTSQEIATLTGKDHKNIIRDIRTMLNDLYSEEELSGFKKDGSVLSHKQIQGVTVTLDNRGYVSTVKLDHSHTITLITGYNAKLRKAIIDRWQQLEERFAEPQLSAGWQQAHDRCSSNDASCPEGYFSIFGELTTFVLSLEHRGLPIDRSFIPDISVGNHWARHWVANDLDDEFSPRREYRHQYPSYFPQSRVNVLPYCYPEEALPYYRKWFRNDYVKSGKFAKYMTTKYKQIGVAFDFTRLKLLTN